MRMVRFAGAAQKPVLAEDELPVLPVAGRSPQELLQHVNPDGSANLWPRDTGGTRKARKEDAALGQASTMRDSGQVFRVKTRRRRLKREKYRFAPDGSQGLLALAHFAPSLEAETPAESSGEDVFLDCGTALFTPAQWHFVFRPPNTGDFNVLVSVPHNQKIEHHQISTMELSVAAIFDNWQPFQVRLVGPSRTSILLKQANTEECADLHCDFTETRSCHSCTRPVESLSAFTGESALGTWIVAFEDSAGRKRSTAVAWAALRITFSCAPPLPA